MSFARVFALIWSALALSWGLFLIVRRNWLSELARELKQQNGMRLAFGSQSPAWMLWAGIAFVVAGLACLVVLTVTAIG